MAQIRFATVTRFGNRGFGFASLENTSQGEVYIHIDSCRETESGWITENHLDEHPQTGDLIVLILDGRSTDNKLCAWIWGPRKSFDGKTARKPVEDAVFPTQQSDVIAEDWFPCKPALVLPIRGGISNEEIVALANSTHGRNGRNGHSKKRRQAMCGIAS